MHLEAPECPFAPQILSQWKIKTWNILKLRQIMGPLKKLTVQTLEEHRGAVYNPLTDFRPPPSTTIRHARIQSYHYPFAAQSFGSFVWPKALAVTVPVDITFLEARPVTNLNLPLHGKRPQGIYLYMYLYINCTNTFYTLSLLSSCAWDCLGREVTLENCSLMFSLISCCVEMFSFSVV